MRSSATFIVGFLFAGAAVAATVEEIHEECWKDNDHQRFYTCVKQRAEAERANLKRTEQIFRNTVSKSQESIAYLKPIHRSFEASVIAYGKYRVQQCSLRRALASMGNGEEENQLACEAVLDLNRTNELKANLRWLINE